MTAHFRSVTSFIGFGAALSLLVACGDDGEGRKPTPTSPPAVATPSVTPEPSPAESECPVREGSGVNFDPADPPCELLSSYRFFVGAEREQVPNDGVVPYDLNTELFSDYTHKHRFVYLPPGTSAVYNDHTAFEFPVGTVLIKSFAYPHDQRDPAAGERLLETRLLIRRHHGWEGLPYVWDENQAQARLRVVGATLTTSGVELDGQPGEHEYNVPNKNQCKACHGEHDEVVTPLGPKARNLNKSFAYPDGEENQLTRWTRLAILTGAPADPAQAPIVPAFDDPDAGSLELRARTYLDVNCGHCHNVSGKARSTDIYLDLGEDDPIHLGVCKSPTAAGTASGNLHLIIDPGHPETSILISRVESDDPENRMPELGRQRVHDAATEVLRGWIAAMAEGCGV